MIRYADLVMELGVSRRAAENWLDRDQLPVAVDRPGRGRAAVCHLVRARELALFLVLADMIGPSAAAAVVEGTNVRRPRDVVFRMSCVTIHFDPTPVWEAVERLAPRAADAA